MRKTTKFLIQDTPSRRPNFNPRPPEYEAGVLTTRRRLSVTVWTLGDARDEGAENLFNQKQELKGVIHTLMHRVSTCVLYQF
jgi:hypothetical protein